MDRLFEIGEIGIQQDIPTELSQLSGEKNLLKSENSKLKRIITVAGVIIVIYLFRKYVWPRLINTYPEDE